MNSALWFTADYSTMNYPDFIYVMVWSKKTWRPKNCRSGFNLFIKTLINWYYSGKYASHNFVGNHEMRKGRPNQL